MKNKGFTLVEFAISFCLIAVVSLLLFELVISMKTLYLNGNIKTTLLDKQAIMVKRIYSDYNDNNLKSFETCGEYCYKFTYLKSDGQTKVKNLKIDINNNLIIYDDYAIAFDNGSYISVENIKVEKNSADISNQSINNSLLTIYIPVYNKIVEGDYGLNINIPYNNSITTVNI